MVAAKHGARAMFYAKLAGRLHRHAGLRMFRMFSKVLRPERRLEPVPGIEVRLLRETDVMALCSDPSLDLRDDSVAAAYARGDVCVGALEGEAVAGYCWLALAPVPHLDGVWVKFAQSVGWTYKSLVRPSHRGRGIAPALYRFADATYLERGRTYAVICVESHNRPSIRAAFRAGYESGGYGGYVLRGRRLRAWSSPTARERGVSFFLPELAEAAG